MSEIWFTADTHLGHCNILEYCKRPFKNHEQMSEIIIQRFAEVIRPGDRLYHLGDVAHSNFPAKNFWDRCGTKEIHLVLGNHDKVKLLEHPYVRTITDLKTLAIEQQRVVLCHYAMRVWPGSHHGSYQLYGHSHGKLEDSGRRQMDVGVDTHNFYPYSWEEVKRILKDRPYINASEASAPREARDDRT